MTHVRRVASSSARHTNLPPSDMRPSRLISLHRQSGAIQAHEIASPARSLALRALTCAAYASSDARVQCAVRLASRTSLAADVTSGSSDATSGSSRSLNRIVVKGGV